MDLLFNRPDDFSVLTGEDILFYLNLTLGGEGGILASAHIGTEKFVSIVESIRNNDHRTALATWKSIEKLIPLLFKEPNPAPLKYILAAKGFIRSDEVRLPLTGISDHLKKELDEFL
jgi:4-hydroxy-tetrahydrodipicolinate synthase